ncbi:MAG: flavin-dependent oxidoreductase [Proteobacteria bacterium]|nr:flavin-dependent oxidoreductase [Pseudomonadota bacterium]
MKAIIIGGGVGGLTTALMCHARGIDCEVYEQADTIRELGVGINTLPHAIKELKELGLLERLDAVAIRTYELTYANRFGQTVWHELRGTDAGFEVPQFSIHRGRLQGVIYQAARARLGEGKVFTGHRLGHFMQDESGVSAYFFDRQGRHIRTARGDVLIGADGIHSFVRAKLFPQESPAVWNGTLLWRGAVDWPQFGTGRSMIIAGGMEAKFVLYPIAAGSAPDRRLTNWAVMAKVAAGGAPPNKEDWSRQGRWDDLRPYVQKFNLPFLDVSHLIEASGEFWEYPLCDREPLPRWSHGRVTLLGDAAHPMYPVGSNGASQAILDARCLTDRLVSADNVMHGLSQYDQERLPMTTQIVLMNRKGGPEGVIDAIEARAPNGFTNIDDVLSYEERKAIVRGYASTAGFAKTQVNKAA